MRVLCHSGKFNFIEFISNSKSGQFFFYSHNGRFMIKTQSEIESKFLRRIMPHYYRVRAVWYVGRQLVCLTQRWCPQYVMKNPHTFITRFYGMHRLKMNYLGRKLHFVVRLVLLEQCCCVGCVIHTHVAQAGHAIGVRGRPRNPRDL